MWMMPPARQMLRPDFTVPVVQMHMENGAEPARYTYAGAVFRRQDADARRPNEYMQAGIEIFERAAPEKAEAEVFALIFEILRPLGLRAATGDIGLLIAAVEGLRTSAARKAALRRHARTLRRIESRFGVEKEVVTAVWGLESTYGTRRGDIPLIESLATLSFDGRRGAFFEKQLIAALKILQSGDVSPRDMKGSWAGAMGHTQFIPTSYQAYAVDFTGDGKRDIWSDDPADALASTAAYLKRFGWTKGQPWGVEVRLPSGFDHALASRSVRKTPTAWASLGVTDMRGRAVPNHGQASILLPAGARGAAFMIFDNFSVLERYNNADAYVIGVGHLSDRLAGGPPIQASWPRGYKPLSFDERKEMQRRLRRNGHALEKIDGIVGPNTVTAIRAYQRSAGLTVDGFPSKDLLAHLRGR
jgi:membrane-bound lytic murein transglycosylase B